MTAYIIRRLLILPIILFGVTLLIFSMLQVLGPVERSALYVRDIPKTDRQVDAIIVRYGPVSYTHLDVYKRQDVPSPANPPSGCRFHPRCAYATDVCREVDPEFRDMGTAAVPHMVACHHAEKFL